MPEAPLEPIALATPSRPVTTTGTIKVRVRYCECDPMGVAHHASYLPWLEMARTELLREAGVSYAQLEAAGIFLVITKVEVRYRRPIGYDDIVEIRTRVVGGSQVKIQHEYDITLVEDSGHGAGRAPRPIGEMLAAASTTLACVGKDGRIRPLPDWLAS
jgi:acyl-CoA thioester hydrolase